MNTLVIGANGQLGHELVQQQPSAEGVVRDECDVTIPPDVRTVLTSRSPSLVINATAYNAVDDAESNRDLAFAINALAPGRLASECRDISADFMHFSTDYVFGHGFADPIDETQTPAPLSVYGATKLHGERLALQNNPRTYIVRTTGLYSHRRSNFVKTMIRHAVRGNKLTVVSDQFVSPTWVRSLATVSIAIARSPVHGVYHVTSQGSCSWYELAARIFEILDIQADLHPIDQDSWGAAAARPSYSALDDAMLRAAGIVRVGRWDDELERFLNEYGRALIDEASAT